LLHSSGIYFERNRSRINLQILSIFLSVDLLPDAATFAGSASTLNAELIFSQWERLHRLSNFRAQTIPPAHPQYSVNDIFPYGNYREFLTEVARLYTERAELMRAHRAARHQSNFYRCDECSARFKAMPTK
jgi:hypothetical protein